jgi:3-methyladenine DNA glycosylase/8-oxoguanine DNA glycosylase
MPSISLDLARPLDVAATLRTTVGKAVGRVQGGAGGAWWVERTPEGAVSLRVDLVGGRVEAEGFGPGSAWVLDHLPDLLGLGDDPDGFDPPPGALRDLHHRAGGLRMGHSGLVWSALLPAVLGQRVTGEEAHREYHAVVRAHGEPAPGPVESWVPPPPEVIAGLRYEDLHPLGVERARASTVIEAARRMGRLGAITGLGFEDGYRRLGAVRGIGPWTAGIIMGAACGDPDAVPIGDYHLPNLVAWVLAGEPRADDDRMLALLEPFRGHRRRVVALLERSGIKAPSYGPRRAVRRIEST